jgi:hypothetical protein
MSWRRELSLLVAADPVSYAEFARATLTIEARADLVRLQLRWLTWQAARELEQYDRELRLRPTTTRA